MANNRANDTANNRTNDMANNMAAYIRDADLRDLDDIEALFTDAQLFLHSQGVPQWQNANTPNRGMAARDIDRHEGYVFIMGDPFCDDGDVMSAAADQSGTNMPFIRENRPCGYAALTTMIDDSYTHIRDGAWLVPNPSKPRDGAYLSVHRFTLAGEQRGKGYAAAFMTGLVYIAAEKGCRDIRIDTHPRNLIMEKVILRAGFSYRGMVDLPIPDGERKAYQLILSGEV